MKKKDDFNASDYLKTRQKEILDATIDTAINKRNSSAQLTLLKAMGLVKEKTEKIDVKISADDFARAYRKAEREFVESKRVRTVPEQLSPLPAKLRLHPGQGQDANDKVGRMAVPGGDSEDSTPIQEADIS